MRKRLYIFWVLALLSLGLMAQEQQADASGKEKKRDTKVFTGFSGGMMLHVGYLFSDNPQQVFSNTGLGDWNYVKGLPKSGFCYGLGGSLRAHLINHIHLGAEGFVSTMPLASMGTGSNVRTGWGGVLCDFYGNWGKVRPMIGLTVGGGTMKRLYVPADDSGFVSVRSDGGDTTHYNASYVKTPFFLLDPYVGLEIDLNSHMALLIRIDYMLPFGTTKSKLTENVKWSSFMTPSGPRLYVGIMFGKLKKE